MSDNLNVEEDLLKKAEAELSDLIQILGAADGPSDASIFLGTLKPNQPDGGWARLNARDDLRIRLSGGIKRRLLSLAERDVVPLEYDAVTDSSIGILPSDFEGGPRTFLDNLPGIEIDGTIKPTSENVSDQKIRLTRFVNNNASECIDVFTKSGNISTVRAAHVTLFEKDLLIPSDSDIFTLSDDIDFLLFRGFYYIFNANAFQVAANFNKAIEEKAKEGLSVLSSIDSIEITNMDDFSSAVTGNKLFARKLAALQYGNYLKQCTGPGIRSYISTHGLNVHIEMEGDKAILTPDLSSHAKRSLFLSVLAEDIFEGGITGQKHRAVKKVPHKN